MAQKTLPSIFRPFAQQFDRQPINEVSIRDQPSSSVRNLISGPTNTVDYEQQFFNQAGPSSSAKYQQQFQPVEQIQSLVLQPTPQNLQTLTEMGIRVGFIHGHPEDTLSHIDKIIYLTGAKYPYPTNPAEYQKYPFPRSNLPSDIIYDIGTQLGLQTTDFVELDFALGVIPKDRDLQFYGNRIYEMSDYKLSQFVDISHGTRDETIHELQIIQARTIPGLRALDFSQLSDSDITELGHWWNISLSGTVYRDLLQIRNRETPSVTFTPIPSSDPSLLQAPPDLDKLSAHQLSELNEMIHLGIRDYRSIDPSLDWDRILQFLYLHRQYQNEQPLVPTDDPFTGLRKLEKRWYSFYNNTAGYEVTDYLLSKKDNPVLRNLEAIGPGEANRYLQDQINQVWLTSSQIHDIELTAEWMRVNRIPITAETLPIQDQLYPHLRQDLQFAESIVDSPHTGFDKRREKLIDTALNLGLPTYGHNQQLENRIRDHTYGFRTYTTHDPEIDQIVRSLPPLGNVSKLQYKRGKWDSERKNYILRYLHYTGQLDLFRQVLTLENSTEISRMFKQAFADRNIGINPNRIRSLYESPEGTPFLNSLKSLPRDEANYLIDSMIADIDILNREDVKNLILGLMYLQRNLTLIPQGFQGLHNLPSIFINASKYSADPLLSQLTQIMGTEPSSEEFNAALDYLLGRSDVKPPRLRSSIASMLRSQFTDLDLHPGIVDYLRYTDDYITLVDVLAMGNNFDISKVMYRAIPKDTLTEAQIRQMSQRVLQTLKSPQNADVSRLVSELDKYSLLYVPENFDLWTLEYNLSGPPLTILRPLLEKLKGLRLVKKGTRSRL